MTDGRYPVVRKRMSLAGSMLQDAELLLSNGSRRSAASHAYFAAFHAARALCATDGWEPTANPHQAIPTALDRRFVSRGKLDRTMVERYHKLRRWQVGADESDFVGLPADLVHQIISDARKFVNTIERVLIDGGQLAPSLDPHPGSDTNA